MSEVTVASLLDDDGLRSKADIVEVAQKAHQLAADQLAAAEVAMRERSATLARINSTAAQLNASQYEASAECVRLILADDVRGLGPARNALERVRSERSLYLEAIAAAAAQIRTGRRAFLEARMEAEMAEAALVHANVELRTDMLVRLSLPMLAMDAGTVPLQIVGGDTNAMRHQIQVLRERVSNSLAELDAFDFESNRIENHRRNV